MRNYSKAAVSARQKTARLRLQTQDSLIVSAHFDRGGYRRALRVGVFFWRVFFGWGLG